MGYLCWTLLVKCLLLCVPPSKRNGVTSYRTKDPHRYLLMHYGRPNQWTQHTKNTQKKQNPRVTFCDDRWPIADLVWRVSTPSHWERENRTGNRIIKVVSRCEMSGRAVIRAYQCHVTWEITQERSLLWSIPSLGLVLANIASEGDARQKTGER